jgi:hypothetical protein
MHLVGCPSPVEPLEDAPRTALLADLTEGEQWDGFWSSQSDDYYVRCTKSDGRISWFQLADEAVAARSSEVRVLTLRPKTRARARVEFVVAQSPNGRRMLVGSAGRAAR